MAFDKSPQTSTHLLEISLISAQNLKKPPSAAASVRRMHAYAVAWVDPSTKLRTSVDRSGGESPTWNDKFLFRVSTSFLSHDSPSAVHIEIYASGYVVDTLVGTVRFLVGNQRLLSPPPGVPSFAAVGIRRPSGKFRGVLNLGTMILPLRQVSAVAAEALARRGAAAVGYRDLMGENDDPKFWRWRSPAVPSPARKGGVTRKMLPAPPLKNRNREMEKICEGEEEIDSKDLPVKSRSDGGGVLSWLFPRKIHQSPSDQNLHLADTGESRR